MLNCVLQRKNFARVGQKPGKTVHINYFRVDGKAHFVDLPGYGYAQVAESEKERWGKLMEAYFAEPEPIALGVMDRRCAPWRRRSSTASWQTCSAAPDGRSSSSPTKLDKLKAREIEPNLAASAKRCSLASRRPLLPFSAEKGTGREALCAPYLTQSAKDCGLPFS